MSRQLPTRPNLEHLKKQFASWPALETNADEQLAAYAQAAGLST
jgi:hypothetical protein